MIKNHVDLLSGKAHAFPTRATATVENVAEIIRDICLRSRDSECFPHVLVVDHDPKFTSEVFRAFIKGMGSCLILVMASAQSTIRTPLATPRSNGPAASLAILY
jgi:hypothetical protein